MEIMSLHKVWVEMVLRRFTSTLGASSGKYYWETKITGTINGMTFGTVDGVEVKIIIIMWVINQKKWVQ